MKIELINIYKNDYKSAYLTECKDGRKRVHLVHKDNSRKWISYAAYLWEQHNNREVPKGFEVDHINNDKTDDRIENLQLLTKKENTLKYQQLHPARTTKCICPVCDKEFDFPTRNLNTHPNPCCSRKCGYVKMGKTHIKNKITFNINKPIK